MSGATVVKDMLLYLVIIQLFFKYRCTASSEDCRLEWIDEVLAMVADFSDALKWDRMVLFSDQVKDDHDTQLALKNMGSVHLMLRGLPWNASHEINFHEHLAVWCIHFSRCQDEIDLHLQYAVDLYIGSEFPTSSGFVAEPLQLQNSLCLECCEKNNFIISYVTAITNDSEEIGHWSHVNGIQIQNVSRWILKEVYGKNFTILVREHSPYVFYEMNGKGETILTGFIIEMLADFAECLNFSYTIQFASDRRTGIEESNSSWSGLMGALQRSEVDFLASDVSIIKSRLQIADFSEPFIRTSSAILVRRVLFSNFGQVYISAFEVLVWCLIVLVVLMAAVCMTVTWAVEKSSKLRGVFGICNHTYQYSWWEAVYSLVINLFEQGNDMHAERFSTRIILIAFLFFSVVILAYNNSVLTAHLAVVNFRPPFDTIEELIVNAPQYQIGIVNGGSYYYTFENSENPGFQMAWKKMSANPENFFNTATEAVQQVATGNVPIAFIDSTCTIKYEIRDSCEFVMVQLKGVTRGYHLAFPKGSRYVNAFSEQLSELNAHVRATVTELFTAL